MPFLPPNQQRKSTAGKIGYIIMHILMHTRTQQMRESVNF